MRNSKVYCLISVCSCFVIILKFIYCSTVTNSEGTSAVTIWKEAALPMPCFVV